MNAEVSNHAIRYELETFMSNSTTECMPAADGWGRVADFSSGSKRTLVSGGQRAHCGTW
jgi:hypothetical protein